MKTVATTAGPTCHPDLQLCIVPTQLTPNAKKCPCLQDPARGASFTSDARPLASLALAQRLSCCSRLSSSVVSALLAVRPELHNVRVCSAQSNTMQVTLVSIAKACRAAHPPHVSTRPTPKPRRHLYAGGTVLRDCAAVQQPRTAATTTAECTRQPHSVQHTPGSLM